MCPFDGVVSLLLCCSSDVGGGVALACRFIGDGVRCVGLHWLVRQQWMCWIEAVGLTVDEGSSRVVACAWVTAMSAPAGNGFVGLVAADASAGNGFVGLVAMKMQALAGGWQASAGSDDDAGWRME